MMAPRRCLALVLAACACRPNVASSDDDGDTGTTAGETDCVDGVCTSTYEDTCDTCGPETTLPSPVYCEPWQGQAKRWVTRIAAPPTSMVSGWGRASARTVQPRWVQTAETAWNTLPSRNTKRRCSGRNFIPSGKSPGRPSFTVVGAS